MLTCVDKANAFKAYAFFRKMFDECAARHPAVATDRLYVDACAAMLVRRPWDFDVMVMENMFGDILSDLTAGLIGGMGMAPSADIGDKHAVFQPCHGTAPDIMGKGLANPTAMILSTALMLDWLADRHDHAPAAGGARAIEAAVDRAFAAAASNRPNSAVRTAPRRSPAQCCGRSTGHPRPEIRRLRDIAHSLVGRIPQSYVFPITASAARPGGWLQQ